MTKYELVNAAQAQPQAKVLNPVSTDAWYDGGVNCVSDNSAGCGSSGCGSDGGCGGCGGCG